MTLSRATAFATLLAAAITATPGLAAEPAWDKPAKGWSIGGDDPQEFDFGTTHVDGIPGKCAVIKAKIASPSGFGSLGQLIAADNYHGQRLRLSALIKTENANRAQLWMRVDGPEAKMLGFYNMGDKPVTGTTDWRRYDVVLDVPPEAVDIAFGYFLYGGGTVWARNFKLETVENDVPVSTFSSKSLPDAPANMGFDK